MKLFERILVAVDDTDGATRAVVAAARLAREHDGELILATAVNWLPLIAQMASSGVITDADLVINDLKTAARHLLEKAAEAARSAGHPAATRQLEGDAADAIVAFAEHEHCTVVVMGTNSHHALAHFFVGSVTAAVLRSSVVPVLTIRDAPVATGTRPLFERIVAGIDESEPSNAAVTTVLDLAAEGRSAVAFYSVSGESALDYACAERVVASALRLAERCGVAAQGRVLVGEPVAMLLEAAAKGQADLIVVGSHGRRGIGRLMLGSVAEHIVRTAPAPVLVIRTSWPRVEHRNATVTVQAAG